MKWFAALALLALAGCRNEKGTIELVREPVAVTASRMQDLVIGLSRHAQSRNPKFLIVPQNAPKLLYLQGDPYMQRHPEYDSHIDALGIEGLFYNASFEPDSLRIAILDTFSKSKKVMVSDFVQDPADAKHARELIRQHGFLPLVRTRDNYDYVKIPALAGPSEPAKSIDDISNFLYLINGSHFGDRESFVRAVASAHHQLAIIDLFFHGEAFTRQEIAAMKKMPGGGERILLGYVNIGAAENWRYYWQKDWKVGHPFFLARPYHGYKDETWVRYWDPAWKKILYGSPGAYVDRLIDAGFDGAYLDNVEAYLYLFGSD